MYKVLVTNSKEVKQDLNILPHLAYTLKMYMYNCEYVKWDTVSLRDNDLAAKKPDSTKTAFYLTWVIVNFEWKTLKPMKAVAFEAKWPIR